MLQITSVLTGSLMAAEAGRPNLRPGKQAQLLDHSPALERDSLTNLLSHQHAPDSWSQNASL